MKTMISIKGMHCRSCKNLIEEVCRDFKGVKSCTVELESGKAEIEHDGTISVNDLKAEIEKLGDYKVEINT